MIKPHHLRATGRRISALALLLTAIGFAVCRAQAPAADEAGIRPAMVFNLTKFIDWPAWKIGDANAPFVIGVLGNDPINEDFENLARDKQMQGRTVVVRRVTTILQARECHVLYFSNSERKRIRELTPDLAKAGVLACIIRERPASDDFVPHKIVEDDDGSVKLLYGALRQALQAYPIKAATIFGRSFPLWSVGAGENGNSSVERSLFSPGDASSSSAMCRNVVRNGNDCGRCMTMRRAEATTLAPSFRKRSRSVQTCALAQLVPAALRRSSCIST